MVLHLPYLPQLACFNEMNHDNFCRNGLLCDVYLHTGVWQENRHRHAGHFMHICLLAMASATFDDFTKQSIGFEFYLEQASHSYKLPCYKTMLIQSDGVFFYAFCFDNTGMPLTSNKTVEYFTLRVHPNQRYGILDVLQVLAQSTVAGRLDQHCDFESTFVRHSKRAAINVIDPVI
eukprot:5429151-Pyramimonas_sp.AAC.1